MFSVISLLTPDKITPISNLYHLSNKTIIPLFGLTYATNKLELKNTYNTLSILSILNLSVHSYISCSAVITDYIKPKRIAKFARISSFNFHCLAILGFTNLIIFKNK